MLTPRYMNQTGHRTSYPAVSVRIPAGMQTLTRPSEVHNRQPLPSKPTPIHPIAFILPLSIAVSITILRKLISTPRRLDLSDLQLDLDQSNGYNRKTTNQ